MRRAVVVFALICALGIPLFVFLRHSEPPHLQEKSTPLAAAERGGRQVYEQWGCGSCHGEDGNGSPRGPALRRLPERWDRQTLNAYLKNPRAFRQQDPRLGQLARRYFPISMPSPEGITERQRALLVDYLLKMK
ncbi:MAG: cytochrome c [Calditrichaeota bacterium]|nr:MAG: cytochrome c [Calditrichota bacterium]